MREKEDNIIGYIEYLSDDGKIIGYHIDAIYTVR